MNSLLLQAKITNTLEKEISSNEYHQLKLYTEWPEFTYHRAGCLNGIRRNIFPKTITDGAQYLLIDDNPYTNGMDGDIEKFPMGCAIPGSILMCNDSFSNEIINFLKFKSGRICDVDYHNTKDEWSKMIWDLLRISCGQFSKRKNAGLYRFPRKNECKRFYTKHMEEESIIYDLLQEGENIDSDGETGVSVIIIENNHFRNNYDGGREWDYFNYN